MTFFDFLNFFMHVRENHSITIILFVRENHSIIIIYKFDLDPTYVS